MSSIINILVPEQLAHACEILRGEASAPADGIIQFSCLQTHELVSLTMSETEFDQCFNQVKANPHLRWAEEKVEKLLGEIRLCHVQSLQLRFVFCDISDEVQQQVSRANTQCSMIFFGNKRASNGGRNVVSIPARTNPSTPTVQTPSPSTPRPQVVGTTTTGSVKRSIFPPKTFTPSAPPAATPAPRSPAATPTPRSPAATPTPRSPAATPTPRSPAPVIRAGLPALVLKREPKLSFSSISLPAYSAQTLALAKELDQVLRLRALVEALKDGITDLESAREEQRRKLDQAILKLTKESASSIEDLVKALERETGALRACEQKVNAFFETKPTEAEQALIEEREACRVRVIKLSQALSLVVKEIPSSDFEYAYKEEIEMRKQRLCDHLDYYFTPKNTWREFLAKYVFPAWLASLFLHAVVLWIAPTPTRVSEAEKRASLEAKQRELKALLHWDAFAPHEGDVSLHTRALETTMRELLALARFDSPNDWDRLLVLAISTCATDAFLATRRSIPPLELDLHLSLQARKAKVEELARALPGLKEEYRKLDLIRSKLAVDFKTEADAERRARLKKSDEEHARKMDCILAKYNGLQTQAELLALSKDGERVELPECVNRIRYEWEESEDGMAAIRDSPLARAKALLLRHNLLLPYGISVAKQFDHSMDDLPSGMQSLLNRHSNVKYAVLRATQERFLWKLLPISPDLEEMDQEMIKLRRGLLLSRKIAHPSILPCEGGLMGEDGKVYLQFRFQSGGDLKYWLQSAPRPRPRRVDVLTQVAHALRLLHEHNVYHRDIKPQNICLDSSEDDAVPKLIDFETSKEVNGFASMTRNNAVGSLGFMAPELVKGGHRQRVVDNEKLEACDVYSFAATAVAVLCLDRCDFDPYSFEALEVLQASKALFKSEQHARLHELLVQCLDQDPKKRPNMAEVCKILGKRECVINAECDADSLCFQDGGVLCPQGEHFMCRKDFDMYVESECESKTNGNITCPACDGKTHKACFSFKVLGIRNADLVANARFRASEANKAQEIARAVKQGVEEQIKLGRVHMIKHHLTENILTNKCPRCRTAFIDFSGCCALTCGNASCRTSFCAFCLEGASDNAHAHVRDCMENPGRGTVFCDPNVYERQQMNRKKRLVKDYFAGLDPEARAALQQDRDIRPYL